MKKDKHTDLFESDRIGSAVLRLALPTVVSQLITTVYNLADTFFVGMTGDHTQLAALSIVFPTQLALTALGNLFGIGAGNCISKALGAKDPERARNASRFAIWHGGLVVFLLSLAVGFFETPFLHLLGSTAELNTPASAYLKWVVVLGALPAVFNMILANMIRGEGRSFHAGLGLSLGGVLNILLDPVFMFVLGLGTAGAGIATALSQTVSFFILLSMFLRGKTVSQFRLHSVTREAREFGMILIGGAPSFGRQGLNSIGGMLLNIAARSYGDAAVAGMSIVSRIFMFILSVVIGVGRGLQPVAAFNYGARKFRRVRQAAIFTMGAAFCMLVVLVALCWVDSDALIRLFRDDPDVTAVALPAFRFQCLAILLQPVIVVANMLFQSVGKAGRATFLACCRQGVFFIPLILILPRTLGLVGVETCQPIADVFTFIVSLPFLLAFLNQLSRMDDAEKARSAS